MSNKLSVQLYYVAMIVIMSCDLPSRVQSILLHYSPMLQLYETFLTSGPLFVSVVACCG